MPFVRIPGKPGLFYVPEAAPDRPQKHPCPDCHFCQLCSDERCSRCLGPQTCTQRLPNVGQRCTVGREAGSCSVCKAS